MAFRDRKLHYDALTANSAPAEVRVAGEVSGAWRPADRGADGVVFQAGRPVLDRDLNVAQGMAELNGDLLRRWQAPSGFLRAWQRRDPLLDFTLGRAPTGLQDATKKAVGPNGELVNAFVLPRIEAMVGGYPVVVEFSHTSTPGANIVVLQPPTVYDGTPRTVKRTDFVFLEVWRALVGPAGMAHAEVRVLDAKKLTAGDFIQVGAAKLTASKTPGPGEFATGLDDILTALAIERACNDPAGPLRGLVFARAEGSVVRFLASGLRGDAGNLLTLATTTANLGVLQPSGPRFSGGFDQPGRPTQADVYRHGNVLSPAGTWVPDDMLDPEVGTDTCLRVQVQYRLRATGVDEAVSFRDHPDGFSSRSSGGATPAIFAQAGRSKPVWNGNGSDTRSYPFVPADNRSRWLESDASAYGLVDDGLWVAGDGSGTAAADLGALDGFVYALPVAMVFRRNNASDPAAAIQGFDPENNTNGGPTHDHAGYRGVLGPIPAGASDRPDGRFADILAPGDLLDLRKHVRLSGLDAQAELDYQEQVLLSADLRTWAGDSAAGARVGGGSGSVGVEHLACEEVGRAGSSGGRPPSSGDTGRGRCARNFDHVARRFSDRPRTERVAFAVWPGSRPTATAQGGPARPGIENPFVYVVKAEKAPDVPKDPAAWTEGDVLVVDLATLDASGIGSIFEGGSGGGSSAGAVDARFSALAPPGTVISDVLGAWHDDGSSGAEVDQTAQLRWVRGLGSLRIEACLDANDLPADGGNPASPGRRLVGGAGLPGSPRRIVIELEVSYPAGQGMLSAAESVLAPDPRVFAGGASPGPGPLVEVDAGQRPSDMETLAMPRFVPGLREVRIEYAANAAAAHGAGRPGSPVADEVVSRGPREVVVPRRVFGAPDKVKVTDLVSGLEVPVDENGSDFGSSTRTIRLLSNLSNPGQTACKVEYLAQDPLPNYGASGYQVGVYYQSTAPQAAGSGTPTVGKGGPVPPSLRLEVLAARSAWVAQAGQGSADLSEMPYRPDLLPLRDGRFLGDVSREGSFTASGEVSVSDLSVRCGTLRLDPAVPLRLTLPLQVGGLTPAESPRHDAEGRVYYPLAKVGARGAGAVARALSGPVRHRTVAAALCRVLEDAPSSAGGLLLRRSEVVLLALSQLEVLGDSAAVEAGGNPTACAALYKTRGLLTMPGDEVCRDL